MARILVTPRSLTQDPPRELSILTEAGHELVFSTPGKLPGEEELIELLPGCTGWLAGIEPVSPRVIAAADTLKAVSRNGTGVDNLPLADLERKGVRVLRAEGANATGVAELAVALMLAVLRGIPAADHGIKAGGWPRQRGKEMRGRVVGVVGCGAVGRQVAQIASAMGSQIIGYDPYPRDFATSGPFSWASLDELFSQSDVVSLHCPPLADGTFLIDEARVESMRPGSVIVNTARAALVDEQALRAALDGGRLHGYGTDVFAVEPPESGSLAFHPKVVATSHIGGFTEESVSRATEAAIRNLLDALAS
ncbi:MAG: phosphoglycerate dehydrogenase [Bauldia sp.]|uniref:phosphoglycerate dehydrogenase n=1 Tax=Bauldia sp. TaxID=2575872 RepID=UPI001E035CB8|nr:phosphoglycerate dehydrogenase [Bauldia sp.]MCB1497366.1 phosphoglycerate dehydrogenase [Bauldia sp.]